MNPAKVVSVPGKMFIIHDDCRNETGFGLYFFNSFTKLLEQNTNFGFVWDTISRISGEGSWGLWGRCGRPRESRMPGKHPFGRVVAGHHNRVAIGKPCL